MKNNMKKLLVLPIVMATFSSTFLVSCRNKHNSSSQPSSSQASSSQSSSSSLPSSSLDNSSSTTPITKEVVVTTTQESITIKNDQIFKYDYTSLFIITVDGVNVTVTSDMVDATKVVNKAGTYEVTCSYEGKTVTCQVIVEMVQTVFVNSSVDTLEIKLKEVEGYDFISLFSITEKGRPVVVTEDMITSTVLKEEGTYTISCTYKNVTKEIEVTVTSSYKLEIIESYKDFKVSLSELESLDYTSLFSLYVDGVYTPVTLDMIDNSSVTSPKVGDKFTIKCSYQVEESRVEKTTTITIAEEKEVVINAKNVVVYLNDKGIDFTSLFTIKDGDEIITPTMDMINADVDYNKIGTYAVTCSYKGDNEVALVEVRSGVSISYATSSTIVITQNTNQQTYNFFNDFIVSLNGVKFSLNNSFIDTSNVDFSTVGEYKATIKVPYGEPDKFGEVSLSEKTLDITYVVSKVKANVYARQEVLRLDSTISSYDYIKNIASVVNGNNMIVTSNRDWATDPTCTYVEVVSEEVDFSRAGEYEIVCHAYPYGLDEEPIVITYTIVVDNGIKLSKTNKATLFEGESVHPTEVFKITKNGEEVEVTTDMIEGKIDCSKKGIYTLVLTYEGEELEVDVVVLDPILKGNYITNNTTIVESSSSSSSTDDEYSESTGEDDYEEEVVAEPLDVLVIDETGVKTLDGKKGVDWKAIDENTIFFSLGSFDYYMHIDEEGIARCEPINENHMPYSENNRPFVYFKEDTYQIIDSLTINTGTNHVFAASSKCVSIDLVKVKNLKDETVFWYGVRYELIDKHSSDYYFREESFILEENEIPSSMAVNSSYSINVLGSEVDFSLTSLGVGKTIKVDDLERKYSNMTFTGLVDNKEATLEFNQYQNAVLKVEGNQIFSQIYNHYSSTILGGLDYKNNIVKIYSEEEGYSYEFALNLTDNTFEVKEKTMFGGLFKTSSNNKLKNTKFFFDGYGRGVALGLDEESTYAQYPFSYTYGDGLVYLTFEGYNDKFLYKEGIIFRIDTFRNELRVADSSNSLMIDMVYTNSYVNDGLKVEFTSNYFNMSETLDEFLEELYASVIITSKDGLVLDEDKSSYIDYSHIDYSSAGLYSLIIKGSVGGKNVDKYYAIQILEPIYQDHEMVGTYSSTTNSKYTFEFDIFGNATVSYYNTSSDYNNYEGSIIFTSDTTFTFVGKCKEDETKSITVTGTMETSGVVSLRISGNKELSSYFYTSEVTSQVTGISKNYVRAFTKGDTTTYFYLTNSDSLGKKVTVVSLNDKAPNEVGSIIEVKDNDTVILKAKVNDWNSVYSGLQLADSYSGTYTNSSSTLVLDGFGVSESKLGDAIIDGTSYSYYVYSKDLVKLFDKDTSEVSGYALVDTNNSNYELISKLDVNNFAGDYGVVSYNAISTSTHHLIIDEYGVGYYSYSVSSTSSDDDSDVDMYADDSSTTTSSSGEFYGRIVKVDGDSYTFQGVSTDKEPISITIVINKLDDYYVKLNISSELVNASNVYMVSNYSETVKVIGNNRANYITQVIVNEIPKYFYFETSDSSLKNATITVKNDIPFSTKGSIFSLKVGDNIIIEEALITETGMTTTYGYVLPNNLKGTFTGSNGDLVLDGFGYLDFDTTGSCKLNNRSRTYKVFNNNVIEVTVSSQIYVFKLNLENNTYERLSSNYQGALLGSFDLINDNVNITFDGYSRAIYTTSGGSIYNCLVEHNATTNEFTLVGDKVNDIYGDSLVVSGKLIAPGVLKLNVKERSNEFSTYFIKEGYTSEVYSSLNENVGTIYKVSDASSNVVYLYSHTNKTCLDEIVNLTKEFDSLVELGEEGAIFKVSTSKETIFIGKYNAPTLVDGYVLCNLDERKTYTSGEDTLFTDGFATSETSRGIATLNNQQFTYYYSSTLNNTIVLFDEDGAIAYYCEYKNSTFTLIEPVLNSENFDLNTYKKLSSPNYIGGFIDFDVFGYFTLENYNCKAEFNDDITGFTLVGSNGSHSITGEGRILENGLIFISTRSSDGGMNSNDYYSTSTTIFSAGEDNKNIIYSVELDGTTKYLYSSTNSRTVSSDYKDYVKVQIETEDIPFGTVGCIFDVYTLEDQFIFRGRWNNPNNGNSVVGHQTSDGYEGTYTNSELCNLILDGFYKNGTPGEAKLGESVGTYTITLDGKLLLTIGGVETKYNISKENKTYSVLTFDKLKDKQYDSNDNEIYLTAPVHKYFVFDGTGGVKYYMICAESGYGIHWASKAETGVDGTYVIEGNQITLKFPGDSYVSEPTFVLTIDDVDNPTVLTVVSTNLFTWSSGYVDAGVTFNLKTK